MISVPDAALLPSVPRPICAELFHHLRGNPSGTAEWFLEMNAGHFPVAGGRVLARRGELASSNAPDGAATGSSPARA